MENIKKEDWENFREVFSILPTKESEYHEKRLEIINKFSLSFIEKNLPTDALTHHIVEMLVRNHNPYSIIEELIRINQDYQKKLSELVNLIPPPLIEKK